MTPTPKDVPERAGRVVPEGMRPVALVGPTATGKSALAMYLATTRGDVEIVSADSMQVYRGMDIGTAKPSLDERLRVRHHLIDVVEPWEDFDLAMFQHEVAAALRDIHGRGRRALLVGGTGLYLRSIVDDLTIPGRYPKVVAEIEAVADTVSLHRRLASLDPQAAARMEPTNRRRIVRALEVTLGSGVPFSTFGPGLDTYPPSPVTVIGLSRPRAVTAALIERRFSRLMEQGLLGEVRRLRTGRPLSRTAAQALGYRELLAHLDAVERGEPVRLDDAVALAVTRTRQFATRQERWFRRDPRITWVDLDADLDVTRPGGGAALEALAGRTDAIWGPAR